MSQNFLRFMFDIWVCPSYLQRALETIVKCTSNKRWKHSLGKCLPHIVLSATASVWVECAKSKHFKSPVCSEGGVQLPPSRVLGSVLNMPAFSDLYVSLLSSPTPRASSLAPHQSLTGRKGWNASGSAVSVPPCVVCGILLLCREVGGFLGYGDV